MHIWRDRVNRWLAPAASRLAVSPNSLTILALTVNLAAAFLLAGGRAQPLLFPLAALTIAGAGVLDALDGAVARTQNRTSRFGDFLDHLCDRISDLSILVGWWIGAAVRTPIGLAAILATMMNGYVGTQLEATFGRRTYTGTGRGEFVLAAITFPLVQFALAQGQFADRRMAGLTIAEWLTIALAAFAMVGIIERFIEAKRLGNETQ